MLPPPPAPCQATSPGRPDIVLYIPLIGIDHPENCLNCDNLAVSTMDKKGVQLWGTEPTNRVRRL